MTRLSFGFSVFPYSRFAHVEEIAEVAALGEELGFDAVTLPEHLLPPLWTAAEMVTKCWFDLPTLGAFIAARTTRLKLITDVMVVPYHPPIQMAKALASLDVLSGGRVLLGVGAGWMRAEFRRLGVSFEERGAITDEYLRAMRELWTADTPVFKGRYVSFEDVSFFPRPLQPGGIPFLIGGTGPKPFQRVAELGAGWLPMTASLSQIEDGIADITRRMVAVGRGADVAGLLIGSPAISLNEDLQIRTMIGHVEGAQQRPAQPESPAELVAAIQGLAEAGVTFVPIGGHWETAAQLKANLRLVSREVLPAFR